MVLENNKKIESESKTSWSDCIEKNFGLWVTQNGDPILCGNALYHKSSDMAFGLLGHRGTGKSTLSMILLSESKYQNELSFISDDYFVLTKGNDIPSILGPHPDKSEFHRKRLRFRNHDGDINHYIVSNYKRCCDFPKKFPIYFYLQANLFDERNLSLEMISGSIKLLMKWGVQQYTISRNEKKPTQLAQEIFQALLFYNRL